MAYVQASMPELHARHGDEMHGMSGMGQMGGMSGMGDMGTRLAPATQVTWEA